MTHEPDRRSLLSFALFGMGAIFSAILGFPVVCYLIDPRHRKGGQSALKSVEGIRLNELTLAKPMQGVIRDIRKDGWTLYPNDVVGRVWVVLIKELPENVVITTNNKDEYYRVFTTICPHLGCSVNLNAAGNGFSCPCHGANFKPDGERENPAVNPAARSMDTLAWQIDAKDPHRIEVQYQNFFPSRETKDPVA